MATDIYPAPTPAGNNNIGDVDIVTLPALPAGNNNIGDVDVATLPALVAGSANIGHVDGQGTAGTPAGGVVSVQGVASGTAQPVSLTTLPALVAGSANIGDVDVLTLPAIPAGNNNIGDVDIVTLPALTAGTNRIGSVRPVDSADADLTAAKASQTSRFMGVQSVKDAGRSITIFDAHYTTTASADTLVPLALGRDGATPGAGATSYTVTSGKRLRIQQILVTLRTTTGHTTTTLAYLRWRTNTGGAVTASSALQFQFPSSFVGATANAVFFGPADLPIPDGWEIAAGTAFGVTAGSTNWTTTTQVPVWDLTVIGYEY